MIYGVFPRGLVWLAEVRRKKQQGWKSRWNDTMSPGIQVLEGSGPMVFPELAVLDTLLNSSIPHPPMVPGAWQLVMPLG